MNFGFIILLLTLYFLPAGLYAGEVSPNVPLSHWSYPLIEKLFNLGLITEPFLNTKPYTRIEVAIMIDEASRNLAEQKIELPIAAGILERLQREFSVELATITEIRTGITPETYLKPIDDMYFRSIYSEKSFILRNRQGDKFSEHSNFRLGFDSYGQYANRIGYYLHPEYRYSEDTLNEGELVEGYMKCMVGNLELELGRDSLWWGPGANGDWILTDNAKPFDLIKIGNAEPVLLPWIFRWLGPMKTISILTRLEEERDYPHTRFWGMRTSFKPKPGIELGFSRSAMFAGEGRPSMDWRDYWDMFWGRKEHEESDLRNNQIAGVDLTVQFNHLDNKTHVIRTMTVYVDGAGEDFASGGPLPSRWAWLYGIVFGDIGLSGKTDLRIEYANNHIPKHPNYWYSHPVYTSGYTYYGDIIGHQIGTDSDDLYIELTHFFNAQFCGSLIYDIQQHGLSDDEPMKVQYLQPQLTFYGKNNLIVSAAYRYEKEDAGSEQGTDQTNHILFLNTIYSF
ncbi:MAG: capsule assembly Wzi family protein [bacterium]|nr:capsule assembly Wzi family protein [bacterium]